MADLRVAVEPISSGRQTPRVYLDGHEMSGVRRVRVCSESGYRTASLDLDLDGVGDRPTDRQRDQGGLRSKTTSTSRSKATT